MGAYGTARPVSEGNPDAIVIGAGPNGLSAAIALAREGLEVQVLEAASEVGGGTRSAELTLPGFLHDVCSAVHPMGVLSPFLRQLPLAEHGLTWRRPRVSVAHPLPDRPAVLLSRSLDDTARGLGRDAAAYRRLIGPLLRDPHALLADAMAPLRIPTTPSRCCASACGPRSRPTGWRAWSSAMHPRVRYSRAVRAIRSFP